MASYYTLSVYNETRRLYFELHNSTRKMPREERYAFVVPLMQQVEKIMSAIAAANEAQVKSTILEPAIETICAMQVTLRNLHELALLTKKGFSNISERTEAVKRQLKGWRKKYSGEGTGVEPESV